MPLCSTDVVEIAVIEVRTDIGFYIGTARGHELTAGVDHRDNIRFRRPEALHVRVHRDRAKLPF
ncbi:hypothetical protein D3C84_1229500 [compost metagenome]